MNDNSSLSNRKYLIICIILIILIVYICQLFILQILSPQYRESAYNNAFVKKISTPSRGLIFDRNNNLLVYNKPTYSITMVAKEMVSFDTLDFCKTINISKEQFYENYNRMNNPKFNQWYSPFSPQLFLNKLELKEYSMLEEKLYKFPGVYIQESTERQYSYKNMGLILGYVAEIDRNALDSDPYYQKGDYIGKSGIEKYYEKDLRGEKGVETLVRDAKGSIQKKYDDETNKKESVKGKDLVLSIDVELQKYGEYLMQNKIGSIVMIKPKTGEILCMVSAPSYDPSLLVGSDFGNNYINLLNNPYKPLINRSVSGVYPPGSTFKLTQGLIFLNEGIITKDTKFPCNMGYPPLGNKPKCHAHYSPLSLEYAISTSCNSFFAYSFTSMLNNRNKYNSTGEAFDIWKDYIVRFGYGYKLGTDLPSESRGFVPNTKFYDHNLKHKWNSNTIISITIGQGEVLSTPLQMANFGCIVANRGYFYTPHIVKEIKGGEIDTAFQTKRNTNIDQSYYETIAKGMASSVFYGTCKDIDLRPEIVVCGKTGTSENTHGKDHSLFIGFAPKDNPEISISVIVENAGFGASTAVPMARLMMQKLFKGEIPEKDKWIENTIANKKILPDSYIKK